MQADTSKRWMAILFAVVIADVTASFETMMVLATLKALYMEFRDPVGVGWLVTAYLLVAAAAAAICGRLGDLCGRKRMVIITLALSALGSLLSATQGQLGWLIAGRSLQGVSAAVFPLSYGLLRAHLPRDRVPIAGGCLMSSNSIGAISGLLLGGLIVDHWGWRAVFWASTSFTVVALLIAVWLLPSEKASRTDAGIDIVGGALFVPAIAGLLLVIGKTHEWGLVDIRTLLTGTGSILLFAWWIRHERRHPDPLIDVRLLAQRDIGLSNLAMAALAVGALQLTMVMMLLLQQAPATGIGLGLSAAAAAALKVPANIASVPIAPLAGYFCRRGSDRRVLIAGLVLNIVSWTMIFFAHDRLWPVFVMIMLSTWGTTISFVAIANHVTLCAPSGRTSEANGVTIAVRSIGNACGAQLMALMLGGTVLSEQHAAAASLAAPAYYRAFALALVCSVVGLIVAAALPGRKGGGRGSRGAVALTLASPSEP